VAHAQSRVPKKTKKTPLKILNSYETKVESPTNESNIVGSELTAIVIRAIPSLSTRSQNKSLNERCIEEQLEIIELAKSTPTRRRKKRSVKLLCKEEPIPSISNHFEQMPHQNVYQDIRDSTSKLCSNNSLNEIENQLSIITYSQLPIITQDFSTEPIASEFTLLDDTVINPNWHCYGDILPIEIPFQNDTLLDQVFTEIEREQNLETLESLTI